MRFEKRYTVIKVLEAGETSFFKKQPLKEFLPDQPTAAYAVGQKQQWPVKSRRPPLTTVKREMRCTYCKGSDSSNSCTVVTDKKTKTCPSTRLQAVFQLS